MAQQYTASQKLLRSAGLTIFVASGLVCAMLAVSYLGSAQTEGWRRLVVGASLILAAVACFAMLADCVDLWMLGRRITGFSVTMIHSLVFVSVLAAFVLSFVSKTAGVLLILTPALLIYLLSVVRTSQASARGAGGTGASRGRSSGGGSRGPASSRSRQRRGGKKRR